jgi:hypothetical protein
MRSETSLASFCCRGTDRFDTMGVALLIKGITFGAILAENVFDRSARRIIVDMNSRGALICISQRPQRLEPLVIDLEIYKCRHLIEIFFCKLKEFKRTTMLSDKSDTFFKAMIYAVAALVNQDESQQIPEQITEKWKPVFQSDRDETKNRIGSGDWVVARTDLAAPHVWQENRKQSDQRQERGKPEHMRDRGCIGNHADACGPERAHPER